MSTKDKENSPIGRRLKSARIVKGISQKQLGILAGIDEFSASPRINQYERGKHVPDFATSKRLAKALSIPVTYLYADDDELADLIKLFSSSQENVKNKIRSLLKQA
ncbi:MAG: helix-turn-helix domain-containing protein [Cocleimonas sp.]|nr:helix-turn-helix domain-containing protein [Cocleimonas sp.]